MKRRNDGQPRRFTLDLQYDLWERLRYASIDAGIPASEIVRELLRRWLDGDAESADALREMYARGVRDERQRVLSVVTDQRLGVTGLPAERTHVA